MRYLLATLMCFALISGARASMQIIPTFVAPGNNGSTTIPSVNNYQSLLESYFDATPTLDVNRLFNNGADVGFKTAGVLTFFYHVAESGFTNRLVTEAKFGTNPSGTVFNAGYTDLYQENIAGTPTGTTQNAAFVAPNGLEVRGMTGSVNNSSPSAPISISVTTADTFRSLGIGFRVFNDNGIAARKDALAGDGGFGVFYNLANFTSINSFSQLFLGYDDNGAGPDDNHDDMIIRVVFTPREQDLTSPVPEAVSMATWGGLIAAGVVAMRSSSRRQTA